ncbi:multiple epidermal growth factor-like domains protein 11 [Haliotis rubra]|uniref:multiple epidermal growth factor-like domains protein 11 n=1 Tax=Haliotis rubra TaxID=36100 RepID=UPI001EE58825|nr:multiple epidermal growth factor-like domains protein 11 [Haliotis rubra]
MAFMRRLNCSLLYLLTSTAYLATTNKGHCGGGTWGEMCKEQCPPGCATFRDVVHCDKLNGECFEGCISGLYGDTCAASCSTGCLDGNCDQFDGKCVQCKEGCFGPDCGNCSSQKTPSTAVQIAPTAPLPPRHACSNGTFGDKCDKPCPTHCIQYTGRSCNETTGVCLNDCLRGFYGERCGKLCSRSCEDSVCQSASRSVSAAKKDSVYAAMFLHRMTLCQYHWIELWVMHFQDYYLFWLQ